MANSKSNPPAHAMTDADARPTKTFFVQSITRDLTLEDALLDLIDNSIDALIRREKIDVTSNMLRTVGKTRRSERLPLIDLQLSSARIVVEDNCGGMTFEHARDHVFRFGRMAVQPGSALGVFGIGMKRALFKLGSRIVIESQSRESGFRADWDIETWEKTEDWTLKIQQLPRTTRRSPGWTKISASVLSDETRNRLRDGSFAGRIAAMVGTTYSLFLRRYVRVRVNGLDVEPTELPIASSAELRPATERWRSGKVHVEMMAGLAERGRGEEWSGERAGWYVLCNGRTVVAADKTDLTGWGFGGPQYVSKYRGFVGIAFFFSGEAAALPWTTSKRGLNRESSVYQEARLVMSALGRPILTFLNSLYGSEPPENEAARVLVDKLKPVSLPTLAKAPAHVFARPASVTAPAKTSVRVQYDATHAELDRVRKHVGKPRLGANKVGRLTLEHFLKTECAQ